MAASIINTNLMSLNAQKNLNQNSLSLSNAVERLSSGLRVNSARDDAAGLAVGMSLTSTVRSLSVEIRNAGDSISTAQIADGEAAVATDILQRMNELAVQAQGTNGIAQAANIQVEYSALNTELGALTNTTVTQPGGSLAASAVAIEGSIGTILNALAATRAGYGATIATAEFQIQRFETERVNQSAALSRIMDADFAAETASLARGQILAQAGTAMVAQANQIPSNVLSLLG
jgi:flagellin